MLETDDYSYHIQFADFIYKKSNLVKNTIYKKLDLKITQKKGEMVMKVCPFCGIIWSKVEGCDGNTTCGSRP